MMYSKNTSDIAIGMPVYNGGEYLEETLESVLNQTHSNFELYISDNASTDNTQKICEKYARIDSRIVYLRNPTNVGAAKNYKICFNPAKTLYFRWQNADDPIEPTLIEKCYNLIREHEDYVLVYPKTKLIDEKGDLKEEFEDHLDLLQDNPSDRFKSCVNDIYLQNLMYGLIRREPLSKTSLLKNYTSSDINLIAELSLYGKCAEIPEYLFSRRIHSEASSYDMSDKEKLKNFWDPSKRKLVLQTWRSLYEYYKAVWRAPISIDEKIKISSYLVKHTYWRKKALFNEVNDVVKSLKAH